ncbi:MAG TPA: prolipoprotein diacylglyceryl transferase family protein [Polyangiaceae bacterium]|nr:prolipoprotein diacylglyceryl transferase family protein [Polyangiaceae bacterium]
MQGRLFTLLDQSFPSYFVLLLVGFVFATVSGAVTSKRIGQDPDVFVDLGLAMLIAGVAGARILHVFADGYFMDYVHLCTDPSRVNLQLTKLECADPDYNGVWDAARAICVARDRDCFAWAKFWNGGLTYYGGFIGASLAAWYLLRRDRFPFWKGADLAGLTIPIGLGFGRMGCLLAGCCFGKETQTKLGLVFPSDSPASEWQSKHGLLASKFLRSLPVHPTQIYESAAALAIAAFCLFYVQSRKRYDGQVFFAFIALYAVMRFIIEIFRSDDRGGFWGLSTSQLIGVGLLGAVLVAHRRFSARAALA